MAQAVIHTRVLLVPVDTTMAVCSFGITHVNTGIAPGRGDDSSLASLRAAIKNSVSTLTPINGYGLGRYIGESISRSADACKLEFYEVTSQLGGQPAGSPDYVDDFTLHARAVTGNLPEGCAIAVGWHSPYGTEVEFGEGGTRPRSRLRNRMFIGPLTDHCATTDSVTKRVKVPQAIAEGFMNFISTMDDINGGPDTTWSIGAWSKAAALVHTASTVYVDDRLDYQRRRSHPGGARFTLTLP